MGSAETLRDALDRQVAALRECIAALANRTGKEGPYRDHQGEEALSRVTTTLTLGAAEVLLAILFCVVRLLALAAKPLRAYVGEHRQGEATGEEGVSASGE